MVAPGLERQRAEDRHRPALGGAAGYLTKDLNPEALLRALRGTQMGELAMARRHAAR